MFRASSASRRLLRVDGAALVRSRRELSLLARAVHPVAARSRGSGALSSRSGLSSTSVDTSATTSAKSAGERAGERVAETNSDAVSASLRDSELTLALSSVSSLEAAVADAKAHLLIDFDRMLVGKTESRTFSAFATSPSSHLSSQSETSSLHASAILVLRPALFSQYMKPLAHRGSSGQRTSVPLKARLLEGEVPSPGTAE